MTYRSAENKIREIMAKSFLKEDIGAAKHMEPANKSSEEERISAALKVLHDNGCPSATAKDGKIEVNAMDANRAADVLDHAIAKDVLQVRPELVSAEAIPVPEPHVPDPVVTPAPVGEEVAQIDELSTQTLHKVANVARKKGRKDVLNAAIKAGKRKRSQPDYKFAGEEKTPGDDTPQQLDEISTATLLDYQKAASSSRLTPMDKRIDKRRKGLTLAAKKITKKIFGEDATGANMILRIRKNIMEDARDGDPKPKLRLKATVVSDSGKHTAKIYKDQDWSEHRVKFFIHGKHHEPADYHTNDYHDAHGTACMELKRLDKLNGALKEATEEELQSLLKEEEQLDELSKALIGRYVKTSANTMRDHEFDRTDLSHRDLSRANGGFEKLRKLNQNVQKRWKGISTGVDKLTGRAKVPATEEVVEADANPFQNSQKD